MEATRAVDAFDARELDVSRGAGSADPGLSLPPPSLRLVGNRAGQVVLPAAAGVVATGTGAAGVLLVTAAGLAAVSLMARRLPLAGSGPPA